MHKNYIFISDIHLGSHSEVKNYQLENSLINLIDFCDEQHIRLVLLGDLYDYWMEYDHYRPALGKRVIDRFRQYHENNPPTLYITGNHDCWMRDYHANAGFDVECEFRVLKINGHNVLAHHGDGISKPELNLPRSLFNRLLRSATFTRCFQQSLPPKIGINIMKTLSRISRFTEKYNKTQPHKLDCWSEDILNNTHLDAVICGHDHIPRIRCFNDKFYINTGAFCEDNKVVLYNSAKPELVTWDKHFKNKFQPGKSVVKSY